jgi:DNA replication protein DnaC
MSKVFDCFSLTTIAALKIGEAIVISNDGGSFTKTFATEDELREHIFCRDCGGQMNLHYYLMSDGKHIGLRCQNPECERKRKANQLRRDEEEKRLAQAEKAHDGSFLKRFGVPPGYFGCTLENFRDYEDFTGAVHCVNECKEFIDGPFRTLLLTGNTGCGKTHIAAGVLRKFVEQGKTSVRFESAAMMLSRFKQAYGGEEGGKSERELIDEYAGIAVLAVDDLGTENVTSNSISLIQSIIDERYSRPALKTIVTSNFSIKRLESMYGSRLISRLTATTGIVLHIVAPDYRKRG